MNFDEIDRALLRILQTDARISNADLARQVNLSPPAVHPRMRRLQEQGVIRGYVAVLDNLQMIWRATDLGRIKSVVTIPAISTHQQQGEVGCTLANVPGNLIRLSVGGEHPSDIMTDLDQALARQSGRRSDTVRQTPSSVPV